MVEQDGTSLILRLLRDIRGKLDEHDRRFDYHDRQFVILNKKIDDWQETTATALGLASHANIRNTAIEEQIDCCACAPGRDSGESAMTDIVSATNGAAREE